MIRLPLRCLVLGRALAMSILCSTVDPALAADGPLVTVERDGTYPGHHPLSMITAMTFDGDTLLVAETSGRESTYPLETITRIWFDFSGSATSVLTEPEQAATTLRALHLFQNRPNPMSLSTSIEFDLPTEGRATLAIYSVAGTRIRTLLDTRLDRGRHTVLWDGKNDASQRVAGGVYFYRLVADGVTESRQMVYLR